MALVSLQQFKEDYRMLDEACRQWFAFIEEDNSRADGIGFGKFYDELCKIKYREYIKNPEDFYKFEQIYPVFLALNKEQTEALNKVLENVIGESDDETLTELSQRLNKFIEVEEGMQISL